MRRSSDWRWRSGVAEDAADALGETRPALLLLGELASAERGQRVEAGLPVLVGDAPLRAHPPILLHAVEGGIERTLLDAEQVVGDALDVRGDGVAVHPSLGGERPED